MLCSALHRRCRNSTPKFIQSKMVIEIRARTPLLHKQFIAGCKLSSTAKDSMVCGIRLGEIARKNGCTKARLTLEVLDGRSLISWRVAPSESPADNYGGDVLFFITKQTSNRRCFIYRVFYVVDCIMKERFSRHLRCVEYEVVWNGGEKSWIFAANLQHAPETVAEWMIRRKPTNKPGEYEL